MSNESQRVSTNPLVIILLALVVIAGVIYFGSIRSSANRHEAENGVTENLAR